MKAYKGQSPFTSYYWRRPIKGRTDLCRLLCVYYFRETKKRFSMLLPGYFNPKELDKLDNKGRILNPHDYDVKTFSRLFYHGIYAAASIEELEMNGVEVKDFNKDILKTAIDKKLKEVGIYDYVAGVGEGVKK